MLGKAFTGLRTLFCACFVLAAGAILCPNGWVMSAAAAYALWALLKKPLPHFTQVLFFGVLALRVAILLLLHPPIESDFRILFDAAHSMLAGDFSYQETVYFSLWGYQNAFVAWEAFWLRLWDSPVCLELLNALLGAGTACLLYRLSRGWVSERAAQSAALLLAAAPFPATLHTILSNQFPSAFFLTLGLWLLVCEDCGRLGFARYPLAGLALQLGNLLRSEGAIFLAAVLAWGVFQALQKPDACKQLAAGLTALLITYFAVHAGAGALLRASRISPNGLQNGNPAWKLVTGLNYETWGGYSEEDWDLIWPTLDGNRQITDETRIVQDTLISERLSKGPAALLRLAYEKVQRQWAWDGLCWAFGHLRDSSQYGFLQQFDRGLFFLALALAGYGLLCPQACRAVRCAAAYLPYFVFFAAFCAFILVEVQPRYAYLPQLYVFTASGFGLECLERRGGHAKALDRRTLLQ